MMLKSPAWEKIEEGGVVLPSGLQGASAALGPGGAGQPAAPLLLPPGAGPGGPLLTACALGGKGGGPGPVSPGPLRRRRGRVALLKVNPAPSRRGAGATMKPAGLQLFVARRDPDPHAHADAEWLPVEENE